MMSDYFKTYTAQARELDEGIEKLVETWKLPHILVGGFAERTAETNSHLASVFSTIRSTQDGINELISAVKEGDSQDAIGIEQLLQESLEDYEGLKDQCDSLASVLAEYNYHYDGNDSSDQTSANNGTEVNEQSPVHMKDLEVEFTPCLSWKSRVQSNEPANSTPIVGHSKEQYGTITPAANSLNSGSKIQSSAVRNTLCTPVREWLEVPVYSKHFYSAIKNK